MSIAGRTTLICACLNNSPIYQMSVYLAPKTITDKIDRTRRIFFWQGGRTKKKYHLVKWTKICKSKKKGGLGIKDLRKMNVSLLAKWWWKLEMRMGCGRKLSLQNTSKEELSSLCPINPLIPPCGMIFSKLRSYIFRGEELKSGMEKRCRF